MDKKSQKVQQAYKYHCKGLNSKEIAKLLNCSYRTVQGYITAGKWNNSRQPTPKAQLAVKWLKMGYTRKEVSKRLNVSISTVDNYRRAINAQICKSKNDAVP